MKKLTVLSMSMLLAVFVSAQTLSPQVISSGGDFFEVTGVGSISWTIGEPVVETFTSSGQDIILTQGFQQPLPEDFVIGVSEVYGVGNMSFNLYPNPAVNNVRIDLSYDKSTSLNLQLIDLLGRVLYEADIDVLKAQQSSYDLNISNLSQGMYLIRLTDQGKLIDTYRVQKASL